MFEREMKHIEFDGQSYPYKCTISVLEKLQERYGTLKNFEMELKFKNQKGDNPKEMQVEVGIGALAYALEAMIAEGIEIEQCQLEPLTETDIRRYAGDEYGLFELLAIVNEEFTRCFDKKKNVRTTQRETGKKS